MHACRSTLEDPTAYLATLDAGVGRSQIVALLLSQASLARLKNGVRPEMVGAAIAMLIERAGVAPLLLDGVTSGELPAQWSAATAVALPAGSLAGPFAAATLAGVYDQLRAFAPRLTVDPHLALPYIVLAPTLQQALALDDPASDVFAGYPSTAARKLRHDEFDRIAKASRSVDPDWPGDIYSNRRQDWKCFGAQSMTADDMLRRAVQRINDASAGSRERRFLKTAALVPRRYGLDEYMTDRWGSRKAVEAVRDNGCLFIVDELALLHPVLRAAADALLVGPRTAIVAVSPCDPSHTATHELLDDLSYLRVGSVVSRFRTDLDPRCEIALNSSDRVDRWLRLTLPELVASAEEAESDPSLVARAASLLA